MLRGLMRLTIKKSLATCLVVLICLSTACTTMRPMAMDATGESVHREITPGDTVRVVTKGASVHSFRVTVVGANSLGGNAVNTWEGRTDPAGSQIEVPYSEISELAVKRTSGLRTAGLFVAALLVVVAIGSGGGRHEVGNYSR